MIAGTALQFAIEQGYAAFAREPRPISLEASPLRDAGAILRTLTSAPLRALKDQDVGPYASWAMTSVGSAREYRHFLPRILELAVSNPTWPGAEPAVIASKLKLGRWEEWAADQREAVAAVFERAFYATIAPEAGEWPEASSWLCGLARLGLPLAPFLLQWEQSSTSGAARQLASFIRLQEGRLAREGAVSGAFWDDVDRYQRRQIAAWLTTGPVLRRLEAALDRVEPEDRWEIEQGLADLGGRADRAWDRQAH